MALPAANAITTAPDEGTLQTYLESWLAFTKEMPGGAAETELTIAGGSVTLTGFIHQIDTEADAAADDLANALVSGLEDGQLVLLTLENDGRLVTLKNLAGGAGQMRLMHGEDLVLRSTRQAVLFYVDIAAAPDELREIARFGFAAELEIESTATTGSPRLLTALECQGKVFTNEGATAKVGFTLPPAAPGLEVAFLIQDVDGMRIVAGSGDTIRVAGTASAAAGYIEATAIGTAVRLRAVNATEWIAESHELTWTFGP